MKLIPARANARNWITIGQASTEIVDAPRADPRALNLEIDFAARRGDLPTVWQLEALREKAERQIAKEGPQQERKHYGGPAQPRCNLGRYWRSSYNEPRR